MRSGTQTYEYAKVSISDFFLHEKSSGQTPSFLLYSLLICYLELAFQIPIAIIWKLQPEAMIIWSTILEARVNWLPIINHLKTPNLNYCLQANPELNYSKEIRNSKFLKIYGTLDSITFQANSISRDIHFLKIH